MPVATVFENLQDGMTIDEVMEQFPVTREQIEAVLDFAARSLVPPENTPSRAGHPVDAAGPGSYQEVAKPESVHRETGHSELQ